MKNVPIEALSQFRLFDGVPDDKLGQIAKLVTVEAVKPGVVVIEDGTIGDTIYLLLEGEVEVTKDLVLKVSKQRINEASKVLNFYSAKHRLIFGEIAMLDENSRRSATVTAATPCKLGVILIEDFLKLTDKDIEIGYHVFKNMAAQLSEQLKTANEDTLNLTTALSFALQR
jgi:CRP-like cAMP-binding protein